MSAKAAMPRFGLGAERRAAGSLSEASGFEPDLNEAALISRAFGAAPMPDAA